MSSTADQGRGLGKWAVTTGAWVLAGFLLITIALIFSAREERRGFPSVTNVRASGYAAFAELLKRDGYQISLDRTLNPQFGRSDLVVSSAFTNDLWQQAEDPFDEGGAAPERPQELPYQVALDRHAKNGGTVVEIYNSVGFDASSSQVSTFRTVQSSFDLKRKYELSLPYGNAYAQPIAATPGSYPAWFAGDSAYVAYKKEGDGLRVYVADGLPVTNRYLDQDQNAAFFLDLVRSLAPHGSRIVFIEDGIGNAEEPTVARALGPWAVVARSQVILLFLVLIYSFGRRFGQPETERRKVRASRELFDAVSDVFRRTNNTGLALDNLLIECDQRMRRILRVPSKTTRHEILQSVPKQLREQYLNVSELAVGNASPNAARDAAAKLLGLLDAFEKDSRSVRGLKR